MEETHFTNQPKTTERASWFSNKKFYFPFGIFVVAVVVVAALLLYFKPFGMDFFNGGEKMMGEEEISLEEKQQILESLADRPASAPQISSEEKHDLLNQLYDQGEDNARVNEATKIDILNRVQQ